MGCFIKDYLDFMANFIEQKREAEEDLLDGDIDFSTEPGLGQLGELVLLGGGRWTSPPVWGWGRLYWETQQGARFLGNR